MNIYATDHINSRTVCAAFAAGSGGVIVPPSPLLPGDVFMYGCLRGLRSTLQQAQAEKRTWFYADNGYLRPGHFDGFYRITRNAYQIDGRGESDGKRAAQLGVNMKPWRKEGRHIVFCPPSTTWGGIVGLNEFNFSRLTVDRIRFVTDRPIMLRGKETPRPLAADLVNAWCLVTYSSNVAVEAVIAGIPVVCLGQCATSAMGGALEDIETPAMPERETWLGVLADNQWNLDEMRNGVAWAMLKDGLK